MNFAPQLSEQEVQDTASQITALGLSKEDEALLLAGLYIANGSIKEAIRILEDLINNNCSKTGIHRMLGDVYLGSNQLQLAQDFYDKELSLLGDNPPCVERLAVKAGLAQIETHNKIASIEVEREQSNQDIEKEFATLASDRQESVHEVAIRNLSSKDMKLAELLNLFRYGCTLDCVNNRYRASSLAHCQPCLVEI
jgi:tetratricopeptide (TPR) repeat protein